MSNPTEPTTNPPTTENKKPTRKKLSSFTSTFNPQQAQAAQGEPIVIAAPGAPETPQNTEDEVKTMQAPTIQKLGEQAIEGKREEAAAQQQTTEVKEQNGNTVKSQKGKDVQEEAQEEKATEKMSIYLTPTERKLYRALMRQYEATTEKRLDENKFFRIILHHIKLETLIPPQPKAEN